VGVEIRISRAVLSAICVEARHSGTDECCGLLLSSAPDRGIDAHIPAANVAGDRNRAFEIDPAALIAAYRAARAGGPAITGCYHSHPGGTLEPSATDAAMAEARGEIWLICDRDGQSVSAWQARRGGAIHGVFDPATLAPY